MINFRKNQILCLSSSIEERGLVDALRRAGCKKIYNTPAGLSWILKATAVDSSSFTDVLKKCRESSPGTYASLIDNLVPEIGFCKHIEKVSGRPPLLICDRADTVLSEIYEEFSIETAAVETIKSYLDSEGIKTDSSIRDTFDSPPSPDITGKIIESSPNGIVFLNKNLEIIKMNSSFKSLFRCSDALNGEHISKLLDPEYFEELAVGNRKKIEKTGACGSDNTICHQILYPLHEHNEYVGIYINISGRVQNERDLEEIRQKAVAQAQELQNHQIEAAQQIVRLIGETTARSENLVSSMMSIFSKEHKDRDLKNIHREGNE